MQQDGRLVVTVTPRPIQQYPLSLCIEHRFNGPPGTANGGYISGRIAAAIGETVNVRLHRPPPLDTQLTLSSVNENEWQLRHADALIAVAKSSHVPTAHVPAAVDYVAALAASRRYSGHTQHIFPTCFVCGPQRERGDGLRIFAGPVHETLHTPQAVTHGMGMGMVAAPWLPHESLDDGGGKVRPEFIWAALDCPGYFASVVPGRTALLGEMTVHIERRVHIEEPCVIMGWQILIEGRKHKVGTALFDEDGERCAVGMTTWIEMPTAVE